MRILCTGGAGYVGSACLRYLLKKGYEAFAFDNLSEGNAAAVPDSDNRLIVGDILNKRHLIDTLNSYKIDAVMHFAAVASVPDSIAMPAQYWEVNVVGTKNVLDAMIECGIKNIVFSSTAATYAFTDKMPLDEADLQMPLTPYGTTKLACESMLNDYRIAYGIGFTVMRYFNASGADLDGEYGEDRRVESHLIPLAFHTAVGRREKLLVYGDDWPTADGSCVRDYVHVEDIAQAHVLAMENYQPNVGNIYNIGSNTGASVIEIIKQCEEACCNAINWQFAPRRPGDPATLVASSKKLRDELHWRPRHSLEAIIQSAYDWHHRYPRGYADKNT
ncbi:UDP-glucose 4-epimerase GalE [SAR92 clade bacterium H455]|uniref:UDP-glucose 4-epimerase n=1 Tax=SAR92 clade bacterium H455 TaxID=2974818 RepID=A0ABY5TU01_9GAMM|nr:UDP-glucose 4-epimerase GalE [SAR92 clade bacterium H455]